jgi:hypothetical protein
MKKRAKFTLTARLEEHLLAYAKAATAAGIGILAATQPLEASVIYTPAHVRVGIGGFNLDVDNDGLPDFEILPISYTQTGSKAALYAIGIGTDRASVQVGRMSDTDAIARKLGGRIGPEKQFTGIALMGSERAENGSIVGQEGSWLSVKHRYLGLKFTTRQGQTVFGWARFNVHIDFDGQLHLRATMTGYAYETTPNKSIVAGDTGSKSGSLGALALGRR